MSFQGVIPILQPPFFDDGRVDYESLKREVDFVIAAGAHGIAFPGFVSEWWKLSDTEIARCAETIIETGDGRLPVILNVTAQATHLAIQQAGFFTGIGAAGLMCLPPFVVPRGPDAVLAHLRAVLGASPLPHILQYSASLTGLRLEAPQLRDLHEEFPHFSCIKVDYIPPGPMISRLVDALPAGEFTYLIGFAGLQLPDSIARGAHGLMGGAGHAAEDVAVFADLSRFNSLLPLLNFEMQTIDQSIATHKWLLRHQGIFASAHVRAPGPDLDDVQRREIETHFRGLAALRERRARVSD